MVWFDFLFDKTRLQLIATSKGKAIAAGIKYRPKKIGVLNDIKNIPKNITQNQNTKKRWNRFVFLVF